VSIQDDIFDLEDLFAGVATKKKVDDNREAFHRLLNWAINNDNELEKLRPIVNGLRDAIGAIFKEEEL